MRYIHIADQKGRNAEILFVGKTKKSTVKLVDNNGKDVKTLRVLKGTIHNSFEGLLKRYQNPEAILEALLTEDPEVDLLMTGRFIQGTTNIFLDQDFKPLTRITTTELVFNPDGSLKLERTPKEIVSNIATEIPVRPGKLFPKQEIYNKYVFAKKYQLRHVNGLTYDFLFEMAKELHDKQSIMMMGAGEKGNEPLIFMDGGKTYRAFLEGRVIDDSYLLLLHLSNLELKPIP